MSNAQRQVILVIRPNRTRTNSGESMLIVWGKRTYGAVHKVGDTSVKTVFGHLWYLPLFPMSSHYVDGKTGASFELNNMNVRSVLCGYMRVWLPVVFLFFLMSFQARHTGIKVFSGLAMFLMVALVIGSYIFDKKVVSPSTVQVRNMMKRHFGVAVDPYQCLTSLQMEIDERMRAHSSDSLDAFWYKNLLNAPASRPEIVELAVLRARCDQHDQPLQQLALQKLPGVRLVA
ncbi:hypothetical protein [Massilia violaceinigra]|nr:hypothetical protein [Massilia violaceinigra]